MFTITIFFLSPRRALCVRPKTADDFYIYVYTLRSITTDVTRRIPCGLAVSGGSGLSYIRLVRKSEVNPWRVYRKPRSHTRTVIHIWYGGCSAGAEGYVVFRSNFSYTTRSFGACSVDLRTTVVTRDVIITSIMAPITISPWLNIYEITRKTYNICIYSNINFHWYK